MSRRTAFCIAISLLGAASLTYAAESDLNGLWSGTWSRDGDVLNVSMEFRRQDSGWTGTFDADRLRVVGIPLRDIAVAGSRVTWKLVGDVSTTTFAGEVLGDLLAGSFEEKGAKGTFRLARVRNEIPQVRERRVTFHNGPISLAGTLLLPSSGSKVPAVVFVQGSGAEGRWASKYLGTRFARAGIAALIYDKRGVGESAGDWRTATYEDLANDAAAAVQALTKEPGIDAAKIGIHGHSQGGTLAPVIAAKAPVAFVIASSAAGLRPDEVETYSLANSVRMDALSAEEAALARQYIDALVGAAYRGEPQENLASAWERVKDKPWAFKPPPEDSHYWRFSRNFNALSPAQHWSKVSAPVLLVYGALDKRVPPRASAARIMQALMEGTGNSATVHIFADGDHSFRTQSPKLVWPTTVDGYPDLIIEWVSDRATSARNRPVTTLPDRTPDRRRSPRHAVVHSVYSRHRR